MENNQVFEKIVDILDSLTIISKDRKMSLKKAYFLLEASFKDTNIGLIPPSKDHVIITGFTKNRISNRPINIVVGLNDIYFPLASKKDLLLGESDIKNLENLPIDTKKISSLQKDESKLNLFKIIANSEEILFSYSLSSKNGEAINMSLVLKSIMQIFFDQEEAFQNIIYTSLFGLNDSILSKDISKIKSLNTLRKMMKNEKVSDEDRIFSLKFMAYLKGEKEFDYIMRALRLSLIHI